MKVYLSGKITGDDNYKLKFANYEEKLKKFGFEVFNPAIMPNMFSWEDFMKLDLLALSFCDAIYLLPDWEQSSGAKREYEEAVRLGIKIFKDTDYLFADTLLKICDDSERVVNHTIKYGMEYEYCLRLQKLTDFIRFKVYNFKFDKKDEENFYELCETIEREEREFFYEEFIKEGHLQIEMDLEEDLTDSIIRCKYYRMIEASKKMRDLAFVNFYESKKISA